MMSLARKRGRNRALGCVFVVLLGLGAIPGVWGSDGQVYLKHFMWQYGGDGWSWDLSIPVTLYNAYKGVPYSTRYKFGPSSWDFLVTTNDSYVRSMAGALHAAAVNKGYSTYEEVSFILAFVQCLPYTSDSVTTGYNDYPRFPLETLVDDGGDCEDTSILFATLVLILNYSAIFINPPGHMAAGVWGSDSVPGSYYLHDGRRYYYCETTGDGWGIGQIPSAYQSVSVDLYDIDESRQFIPSGEEFPWWVILVLVLVIGGIAGGYYWNARRKTRREGEIDENALESAAPGAPPIHPRL